MTIPIRPTAAWMLAQGLGQGIGALTKAREEARLRAIEEEQRQRQNDMQNVALWSQILPSLSGYQAPQPLTLPDSPLFGMAQGAQIQVPEQFNVPEAPGPIAQSLKRITGQGAIGLSPSSKAEFRKGALEAQTLPEEAKAPALRNKAAQISIAKGEYDLSTQESRDATAYATTVAPNYVQAAIASGLQPSQANSKKLIDQAYAMFQRSDTSPWAGKVSRELFAKAVGDEIDEAEKMGLQWYHAKTQRLSAVDQADPWRRTAASVDNYSSELNRLQVEQQKIAAQLGPKALMLGTPEGAKDAAVVDAMERIKAIEDMKPVLVERRQRLQNLLDAREGIPALDSNKQADAGAPTKQYAFDYTKARSSFDSIASSSSGREQVRSALIALTKQGQMSPEVARLLAKEYKLRSVDQELMP
jgi:hypothetical protein